MKNKDKRSRTISNRLVIIFVAIMGFVTLLAVAYTINIFALKANLGIIEDFYSLFNNVLELRRYEKNFIYGLGTNNLEEIIFYLDTIDKDSNRMAKSIIGAAGEQEYRSFLANLTAYRQLIEYKEQLSLDDAATLRRYGKEMVDFSQRFLNYKRQQFHNALHTTLYAFVMATGGVFVFILSLFFFQTQNILRRLASLQEATRKVASGNFTPIQDQLAKNDEISSLVEAFNKMAEEIETKQEQLLQAKKLAAIGTFSSGIAHELNNPLNNISLTADTLRDEYDTMEQQEALEMIDDIIVQTDRASRVVRNLLSFSRETPPAEGLLNIKEVIEASADLIRNQLRLESIWLEDYVPDNLPLVHGDPQKLQQVFLNLFLNSIQAMSGGGLIHIEGKAGPEGYVQIDFNDTGCGIPPKKLEYIFDPFFTTKPVGKGTGLGLSIVYGIIKKYGGYVEVRSKVNVGTTFSIFLPTSANRPKNRNHDDKGSDH